MKINTDWRSCVDSLTAKRIKTDSDMIKSILKASESKLLSEERLEMDSVTATSKFSLMYESLREVLEALAIKKGYKIYNHECYTYFLKEVVGESLRGDDFDAIRKVRNNVNYYGKELNPSQSKTLIDDMKKLRTFLIRLI